MQHSHQSIRSHARKFLLINVDLDSINEHLTWKSRAAKVAKKISRTLGVMNRLKRYLPLSALKTMYNSLILSQLQFGITRWGFEWNRIFKLQKRAVRIMTNSKYNSHTEPLFKELKLLKISDIFKIQCMKFWYKFKNKTLPSFFKSFFKYNHEMHDKNTRNRNSLHLFPTLTEGAKNVLRHHVPELLEEFPEDLLKRVHAHSIANFDACLKDLIINSYKSEYSIACCYICNKQ